MIRIKQSRVLDCPQPLQLPHHRLPVGALPVDPEAVGALDVVLLGLEDVGGHQPGHLGFAPLLQRVVTFKAEAEGPEVAVQPQLVHHLLYLLLRPVAADEDGPEPAAGDDPPLHHLGVPRHDYPSIV